MASRPLYNRVTAFTNVSAVNSQTKRPTSEAFCRRRVQRHCCEDCHSFCECLFALRSKPRCRTDTHTLRGAGTITAESLQRARHFAVCARTEQPPSLSATESMETSGEEEEEEERAAAVSPEEREREKKDEPNAAEEPLDSAHRERSRDVLLSSAQLSSRRHKETHTLFTPD